DADLLQLQNHLAAHILIAIGGRDGEVTFLVAGAEAHVGLIGAAGIPAPFIRVHVVVGVVLAGVEADVIENKKLGLGAEEGLVGDAVLLKIFLGAMSEVSHVAIVR